jgi:hypothetical protein
MATRKKPAQRRHKSTVPPETRKRTPGSGGKRPGAGRKASPGLTDLVAIERKGTIAETAREYAFEAIASLATTMRDPFAKAASRNAAAKHILDAAKAAEGAEAEADTRECTDMDLARWILSVLEGAAAQQDAADK